MQDQSLAKLDAVLAALEAATTVQEIKSTIDMAVTMEVYAKQAKLGKDIELRASEYVVRAERKLGEMLSAAKAAGQIREGNPNFTTVPKENSCSFTLKEAGISRKLSSQAQKIAAIPKADFEKRVATAKESGKLTSKKVARATYGDKTGFVKKTPRPIRVPKPHPLEAKVLEMANAGMSRPQIATELGTTSRNVREIEETGILRSTGEPEIDSGELSLTAHQKLELAIKQREKKLLQEFEARVATEVDQRVRRYMEIASEKMAKERQEYKRVMEGRKGFMTREVYRDIRACLHPDRGTHPERFTASELQALYSYAFNEFSKLEKCILDEKESPTPKPPNLPRTVAEWEAMRRKVTAEKAAARKNHQTGVTKSR